MHLEHVSTRNYFVYPQDIHNHARNANYHWMTLVQVNWWPVEWGQGHTPHGKAGLPLIMVSRDVWSSGLVAITFLSIKCLLVKWYHSILYCVVPWLYCPCIQTGSRLPGTVWRGLTFFTTDRPDYHRMPPPAGDNHDWVFFAVRTGFALGHRASTFHACAHLITTAVRYQLRAQGRYFVPEPNMVGGVTGRSPGERPHDGIAGGSPV